MDIFFPPPYFFVSWFRGKKQNFGILLLVVKMSSVFIHRGAVDLFFNYYLLFLSRWFRGAGYRWINSVGLRLLTRDEFNHCVQFDDAQFRSWTSMLALKHLHYNPQFLEWCLTEKWTGMFLNEWKMRNIGLLFLTICE